MNDTSPPPSIDAAPRFYFGIPLRSRRSSLDWTLVCRNLSRTLDSLRRQTSQAFGVLIACHDIPEVDTTGLHVEFVVADFDPPPAIDDAGNPGNDKAAKKRLLGLAMKSRMGAESYYMHLDADDLVHPSLVASTLDDDNRRGYLIERGYMFDCASGRAGRMDTTLSEFWRHCGSCAVVHFTDVDMPARFGDNRCYFTQFKKHSEYAQIASEHGRPLSPYPEPMAAYLVNHGENDVSAYRGKLGIKSKYVERSLITNTRELSALFDAFPTLRTFT